MINLGMQRLLDNHECLDVLQIGTEIEPGVYELRSFTEGMDYADAQKERWVYSIGRERSTGRILAATDSRFFMNDEFTCLWLR